MPTNPTSECGALIIGGAHGSLAVARSLGRRGIPVFFLTDDHPITRLSRYTRHSLVWAGPDRPDAVSELLDLAKRRHLDGWVLFPGGDAEAQLIAKSREQLSGTFRVITPVWDSAQWALDKRLTYQRAAAIGIDHPWSYYPRDRQDVAALDVTFPLVLKPTMRLGTNAFTLAKAWRVDDRAALVARYDQAVALVGAGAIVLQELIPGDGKTQFSYAAVFDRGRPIASLTARRTRQYPIDFGYTSTFVETIEREEVEAAGAKFLTSLDYSGMAEVEFKYDSRCGRYKILDANIRTWTWTSLGALAGVDFPMAAWQMAMGESVPVTRGRPGVGWMHVDRDVVTACRKMFGGTLAPADYFKSFLEPLCFAAFTLDDPLPGLADLPLLVLRLATRRLPRMARDLSRRWTQSYSG